MLNFIPDLRQRGDQAADFLDQLEAVVNDPRFIVIVDIRTYCASVALSAPAAVAAAFSDVTKLDCRSAGGN